METPHIKLNVPLSYKQVINIVKQLSISEKQQLGEVLWSEQSIDTMVVPEKHKKIVRQRIAKYDTQPDSYLSWDDIETKIANKQ